ncbi:hypothetical protein VB779_08695 [Haloarculaceae archaeon H-GB11]|nr:hypothetical protein [Haloarculaceae archaeon H-GB11]
MVEFGVGAELRFEEVNDPSLRALKSEIERELSGMSADVSVGVDSRASQSSQVTGRRQAMAHQVLTDQTTSLANQTDVLEENLRLDETRNDLLRELLDATEEGDFTRARSAGGGGIGMALGALTGAIGGTILGGALLGRLSDLFENQRDGQIGTPPPQPRTTPRQGQVAPRPRPQPSPAPAPAPAPAPVTGPSEQPAQQPTQVPAPTPQQASALITGAVTAASLVSGSVPAASLVQGNIPASALVGGAVGVSSLIEADLDASQLLEGAADVADSVGGGTAVDEILGGAAAASRGVDGNDVGKGLLAGGIGVTLGEAIRQFSGGRSTGTSSGVGFPAIGSKLASDFISRNRDQFEDVLPDDAGGQQVQVQLNPTFEVGRSERDVKRIVEPELQSFQRDLEDKFSRLL